MEKYVKCAALLILLTFAVSGCFFPSGRTADSPEDLAMLASSVSDFKNMQVLASMGSLEVEDLEETGSPRPSGEKSLITDEWIKVLPDGTVVTWVRIIDDKDTPDDPEDDTVTVTRTYNIWAGEFEKIEKIVRPRKPEAGWRLWVDDRLVQEGTSKEFIDGVKVKEGTLTVTWKRCGDEVSVEEVIKESYRPDRSGGIVRIVITVDDQGLNTRTKYRIRLTRDGEVVVHSFTYEEFIEDGQVYVKIIRDDGYYAIVRNPLDPRITEYYTPDGILLAIVTETRSGRTLYVEKEFFDETGNLIATRRVRIEFRFLGDQVVITKTFDNGRTGTIIIEEEENGYTVNRNGFIYRVTFIEHGVEIHDGNGNLIATVIFNDDGTWTIVYPDGTEKTVSI